MIPILADSALNMYGRLSDNKTLEYCGKPIVLRGEAGIGEGAVVRGVGNRTISVLEQPDAGYPGTRLRLCGVASLVGGRN